MKTIDHARRRFLAGASSVGALSALGGLTLAGRAAAAGEDYKALVCIVLTGGNDSANTIVPLQPSDYFLYAAARSAVAVSQADAVPLAEAGGVRYGLHPNLAPLKAIWDAGQLGVVFNTGPLTAPGITRDQYRADRASVSSSLLPVSLGSHSHQTMEWMNAMTEADTRIGWGGRMMEQLASMNVGTDVPASLAIQNGDILIDGPTVAGYTIPKDGTFGLWGAGGGAWNVRDDALLRLIRESQPQAMAQQYAGALDRAWSGGRQLSALANDPGSTVTSYFNGVRSWEIGQYMERIARLIEGRQATGLKRQFFMGVHANYDTHQNQNGRHPTLLNELGLSLRAFYDALSALGVLDKVTVVTLSEFGRTLKTNDSGTDHGWGGHQLVFGAGVRGGRFYGTHPSLVLGGADDLSQEGLWIPSLSVEQYLAPMVQWMGVPSGSLDRVFPNVGRFSLPLAGLMA